MVERLRSVTRLFDEEKMAPLCREFGISRKTGYKIFNRYKDEGLLVLDDRARNTYRHSNCRHRASADNYAPMQHG